MSKFLINKLNVRQYIHCASLHHETKYAEPAADIIAKEWNHSAGEKERNIESMIMKSKDTLPCHLALVIKSVVEVDNNCTESDHPEKTIVLEPSDEHDLVVAHVKLLKVDGRSDGPCCSCYSLVVMDRYRGLGLGRLLTEEAENYAQSRGFGHIYLSTNDKVKFYEHIGYKKCEPVASLSANSKRLTSTQVSALEGVFAKRLNICNPTTCNSWLRKRLIQEYPLTEPMKLDCFIDILTGKLGNIFYDGKVEPFENYIGWVIRLPWQQQIGPSCGISALNMIKRINISSSSQALEVCSCISRNSKPELNLSMEDLSVLEFAIKLGISYDGELFCAYNLIYLAQKAFNVNLVVREFNETLAPEICKNICNGFPMLVPYDKSINDHTPGCYNAKQAHWAVIVGVIFPGTPQNVDQKSYVMKNIVDNVKIAIKDIGKSMCSDGVCLPEISDDSNIMLICMHGMSSKPFVCTLRDMLESNHQLNKNRSKYFLSAEDLEHLRNKIVCFHF